MGGELHIDREPDESEDNYCRRVALFNMLFGDSGSDQKS
jgi:hypothetical protein